MYQDKGDDVAIRVDVLSYKASAAVDKAQTTSALKCNVTPV